MSVRTRVPPLGIFKLLEGTGAVTYALGLSLGAGASLTMSQVTDPAGPWMSCPVNPVVSQATAEDWFGGTGEGFVLVAFLAILRPGNTSTDVDNQASGHGYGTAPPFTPMDFPLFCSHVTSGVDGLPIVFNEWGYVLFENMPFWETHPLQFDMINHSAALWDPAKGNGVQVWCADTPGVSVPTERVDQFDGRSTMIYNWPVDEHAIYTEGSTLLLPQRRTLLFHATAPGDFPFTLDVPAGRAVIMCTGNQDPQSLTLGTAVINDIGVGFVNPNPKGAYKSLRSDRPTESGNLWTVSAASQLRIRSVIREVFFGGTLNYEQGILIYRDPAQLTGNTLRIPISEPFLWFIEDPASTNFGGVINATLRAYAVDESELTGTSTQNFDVYKTWDWTDLQTRLGAVLTEVPLVTSDENTFSSGVGNMDADLTGGRQLVWYTLSSISAPGSPGAGLHPAALFHSNPSII